MPPKFKVTTERITTVTPVQEKKMHDPSFRFVLFSLGVGLGAIVYTFFWFLLLNQFGDIGKGMGLVAMCGGIIPLAKKTEQLYHDFVKR
ncbi:MAG TPA: hypothetical protein VGG64_06640 [Pirellulales bacterium]|jgi:hypothetical protein